MSDDVASSAIGQRAEDAIGAILVQEPIYNHMVVI